MNTSPASAGGVGLELKNLRIVYDGFVAVADTSLRVEAGESFGIVGWRIVELGASTERTRMFVETIRTAEQAVTALPYRCWLP